jgi:hypothetical protein
MRVTSRALELGPEGKDLGVLIDGVGERKRRQGGHGAAGEESAQDGAAIGCLRQSSIVCPHGGVGHWKLRLHVGSDIATV